MGGCDRIRCDDLDCVPSASDATTSTRKASARAHSGGGSRPTTRTLTAGPCHARGLAARSISPEDLERALHCVEHRRPLVVGQHVLAPLAGQLRGLLGRLRDEPQTLAELELVRVDEAASGPFTVPGDDVTLAPLAMTTVSASQASMIVRESSVHARLHEGFPRQQMRPGPRQGQGSRDR